MTTMPQTTDIIIIGSGAAGLTAALTAAYHGAEVTVLESADKIGGTSVFSGGMTWVPNNHHVAKLGHPLGMSGTRIVLSAARQLGPPSCLYRWRNE